MKNGKCNYCLRLYNNHEHSELISILVSWCWYTQLRVLKQERNVQEIFARFLWLQTVKMLSASKAACMYTDNSKPCNRVSIGVPCSYI